ncbi:Fungal specific transcription factor domain [Ceratobasidium sp. AG-Ba]|nr:Fungal specific transcription factor domain [Ceratobasidium sp. AG-Ba]
MLLGARIIQAIRTGTELKPYSEWIARFHDHLTARPPEQLSNNELVGCLSGLLDLSLNGFIVSKTSVGYPLFRRSAPFFAEMASRYLELWTRNSMISLHGALNFPGFDISRFSLCDILVSLAFGTSPLIHYDTLNRAQLSETATFPVIEWVYGCSADIMILLAQINAFRASGRIIGAIQSAAHGNRSYSDWQEIEHQLKYWKAAVYYVDDSATMIHRVCVCESWRHAGLIYLYMGMCGVNSADPRVESSLHQLVRIASTSESDTNFDENMLHALEARRLSMLFSAHEILVALVARATRLLLDFRGLAEIAGAAARKEKHRAFTSYLYSIISGTGLVLMVTRQHGMTIRASALNFSCMLLCSVLCELMKSDPSRPGPAGTSCLTCKRRRKKCDRARPFCDRCESGGFVCLGYGHLEPTLPASGMRHDTSSNTFPTNVVSQGFIEHLHPENALLTPESSSTPYSLRVADKPQASTLRHDYLVSLIAGSPAGSHDSSSPHALSSMVSHLSVIPCHSSIDSSGVASTIRRVIDSGLLAQILPSLRGTYLKPDNAGQIIDFALTQHDQMVALTYFKPEKGHLLKLRSLLIQKLQDSQTTRLTLYLTFEILRCVMDRTSMEAFPAYINWLNRFNQRLHSASKGNITSARLSKILASILEITLIKSGLVRGINLYRLLQESAPAFLRLAHIEIGPRFSPQRILGSTCHELGQFMLLDSLCSMIYALPQVIEYDISEAALQPIFHPVEWAHGCPSVLQSTLVEINSLFHRKRAGSEVEWQAIEQRLKSWQPTSLLASDDTESWKIIAHLSIQECWRHTLLIYAFMTLDGATSDDPRVEGSVQQVFRLITAVNRLENYLIYFHIVAQYIIAGICARSEKHRAFAREGLEGTPSSGLWMIAGSDFVDVLDHLWHNAAADGRPIRWDDYIHARQTVLSFTA